MFETHITPDNYRKISATRANAALRLIQEALAGQIPPGYVLSMDPQQMYGNALLAIRPTKVQIGSKMISFMHSLSYRSRNDEGEVCYLPTGELLRAHADVKGGAMWITDVSFGEKGGVDAGTPATNEVAAMVRHIVSQVCAHAPFTTFEWRRSATDAIGTWELFNGSRKLQTIWRSGTKYATLMGTTPKTLADAKGEAEASARLVLASEHHERLAALGLGATTGAIVEEDIEELEGNRCG